MSNQIRLKRGSGSNPSASDLVVGEVALRTDNGKLFTKKDDNSITEIGSGISDGDKGDITISNSGGTFTIDNGVIDNANINASAAIAGTKISPDFGSQNIVTTGFITSNDITIQDTSPRLQFTDTNHNDDFAIVVESGLFKIIDTTNNENRLFIHSDGEVDLWGHVDIGAGLDVTGEITATSHIDLPDNAKLKLGTSDDLQIYHDGSHSYALNTTGNLFLGSNSSVDIGDGDFTEYAARFTHDGAVQLYFDNSKKFETTSAGVQLIDNSRLVVGTGGDGEFYHDGSHTYLKDVGTGNLRLAADSTIVIQKNTGGETIANFIPDGAVELYFDNSKKLETQAYGAKIFNTVGSGGTRLEIQGQEGQPAILQLNADDGDDNADYSQIYHGTDGSVLFQNFTSGSWETNIKTTGNGAAELYFDNSKKFATHSNGSTVFGDFFIDNQTNSGKDLFFDESGNILKHFDNVKSVFGDGNDLQIYHDGSHSYIDNNTGSLRFRDAGGAEKFRISGSGTQFNDDITLSNDNDKINIGASSDLQIYHDGSNSYIKQVSSATGDLLIFSDGHDIEFITQSGGHSAKMIPSGAVELYHDNSKKFETTSLGTKIIGDLWLDNPDNAGKDIQFDSSANKMKFDDNVKANFGSGDDLEIYHDGSHSYIENTGTGHLYIIDAGIVKIQSESFKVDNADGTEQVIKANPNAGVEIYYDNSKMLETTSNGVTIVGEGDFTSHSLKIRNWGLIAAYKGLFHANHGTSTNEFILINNETHTRLGTGSGGNIQLEVGGNGEDAINCNHNGAVELYYDNSKQFETTADGVDVQGNITIASANNAPKITFDENGANDPKAEIQMDQTDGSNASLKFKTEGSGTLSTRMTIASDGNVGIGKTSSSLDVDGSIFIGSGQGMNMVKSGSGGKILTLNRRTNVGLSIEFFRGSSVGSISHNNSSTAYNTTSDYRLKENVVTLSDAITRLKTLKPYRFNFIADKDVTVDGFLAHEVTAVPEAVTGTKDAVITQEMIDSEEYEEGRLGDILPQGIDQAKLVPLVVAALKEAVGKIELLETEVAALKAG